MVMKIRLQQLHGQPAIGFSDPGIFEALSDFCETQLVNRVWSDAQQREDRTVEVVGVFPPNGLEIGFQ